MKFHTFAKMEKGIYISTLVASLWNDEPTPPFQTIFLDFYDGRQHYERFVKIHKTSHFRENEKGIYISTLQ